MRRGTFNDKQGKQSGEERERAEDKKRRGREYEQISNSVYL